MSRQDLIVFSTIYALIIAVGHSGPLWDRLKKLPWNYLTDERLEDPHKAWNERFWATQNDLFAKVMGIIDPSEKPAAPERRTGLALAFPRNARPAALLTKAHSAFHRLRPLAGIRRTPVLSPRRKDFIGRDRGPQG